MKFMISWEVHSDQRHEALKAFSEMTAEDDAEDQSGVRVIGRWHDLAGMTGVAICETDDPAALGGWMLNWNSIIDLDVRMVVDDAEARAIGKAKLG